ncbi:MAG: HAMP domain-containing sensor histidine kinase [Bacteroidales bacterium]|nr:HAMP domain-containing sensor histidine kinase [Bacteroidales bacterium]
MMQLKEPFENSIEKYIIKNFPIVPAYDGIDKYESILLEYGYVVIVDNSTFCGIVTPSDLLKKRHKLAIDCVTPRAWIDHNASLNDIIEFVKNKNTYLVPVYKNNQFYGLIIFIQLIEQIFASNEELNKTIHNREKEIEAFKSQNSVAEQIKREFINNVSHEFRTPINAIVGFSEIIGNKKISKEKQDIFLRIIKSSGYRLLKLVDDLIEFSRLKSGDIRLEYKICSINDLFNDILIETEQNYQSSGKTKIKFEYFIGDTAKEYFFTSDEFRIKQIFSFLIDNATKFSKSDIIHFGCQIKESNKIEFYVRDFGTGIPLDKINLLLDGFTKLERNMLKFHEGMGIGLSLTNKMVELMGGELKIESKLNEGTTVFFSLPISGK